MPGYDYAHGGARDICSFCGEEIYLVPPVNPRGMTDWVWLHDKSHSIWCPEKLEAKPVNHKHDEDVVGRDANCSGYYLARTPISQLGYIQKCRYYELDGAGPLKEITEGEYEFILKKACKIEDRMDMMKPFMAIQYLGRGYIVLPTEG